MKVKNSEDEESVHLMEWPKNKDVSDDVLENMSETRRIVSLALEARAKTNIKVRQTTCEAFCKRRSREVI